MSVIVLHTKANIYMSVYFSSVKSQIVKHLHLSSYTVLVQCHGIVQISHEDGTYVCSYRL